VGLRELSLLQRDDADETRAYFLSTSIQGHAEKALQYATELVADVEQKIPVTDLKDHLKTLDPPQAD